MDTYIELLVKKKKSITDNIIRVALIIFIIVSVTFLILFLGAYRLLPLGFLLSMGIVFGGFYLVSMFDIEYEYIVTNGELDVDKIIAKKRRKRLLTIDAKYFEKFARYTEDVKPGNETTTIVAVGGKCPDYYADFKHEKYGNVRLIFSPDKRVIDSLEPRIPVRAKQDM